MQKLKTRLLSVALAACSGLASLGATGSATAQNIFSPVVIVNDGVITEFEVQQRQRFLSLLNAPGSGREAVVETLIDEQLRAQAIAAAGLEISPEALASGLTEFAARAELETEEFISVLEENGVARESFEAFVATGIGWREYIRARYGNRAQVSEAEVDRALGTGGTNSGVRVLLSEIIIPAEPATRAEVEDIARQIATVTTFAEFSSYAGEYSAAASRDNGGRLDWQTLDTLPPVLRPVILALAPGEVTEPLALPDAVALFQLRDIAETAPSAPSYAAIDYAAFYISGGRTALAQAEQLRGRVDVCDDLYAAAQGLPEEVLDRGSRPPAEIPQDIAAELARLDPGEVSTALTRNGGETLVFLMLCGRTSVINEEVAREDAAAALRQNRITAFAEGLLEQLRADARIVRP